MDHQERGRLGEWPVAQQRLVGIRQDHSLGIAVVLDFFPALFGHASSTSCSGPKSLVSAAAANACVTSS